MKIILISLLVFLFMFWTGAIAHAQDTEWGTLNDEVKSLFRQGLYDRAVVVAKKALQVAEQTKGLNHPDVAASLNNLAALYYAQGQYSQAELLYKRSLVILEKILGSDHADVATSLNNLAGLYYTQDQYVLAESLYTRSLAISEKALGLNHPDVTTVLENMAILYRKTDRKKTADELEKRAASNRNMSMKMSQVKDENNISKDRISGEDSLPSPAPITMTATTAQVPTSDATTEQSVGAPAIMLGDSYTFEVENTLDRELSYVATRKITAIDGDRLTVLTTNLKSSRERTTYYDRAWGYLGSGSGVNDGVSFSPSLKYYDFPLSVGKKWTAQSIETDKKTGHQRQHTIIGTVEGWEKVQVPAGKFEALKIVIKTVVKDDDKISPGTDVSWYVPALRRSVKSELTGLDVSTGREEKKIVRLLSYHIQ